MSARVVMGLAPAGKPHPATKWSLLMAMMVVVVLGVPKLAMAGQPSVQPPTGAGSGGVFTGTYTFNTYIYCSSGLNYSSSYSNNLDGTHTFAFYGSADGSLLVTIDGGGLMLSNSCGDPFTGPNTNVATYTVSKNTAPPATPTPTPTPTPVSNTPTPTPAGGGNSGGGSSGGSSGSNNSGNHAASQSGGGSSNNSSAAAPNQTTTQPAPVIADGAPVATPVPVSMGGTPTPAMSVVPKPASDISSTKSTTTPTVVIIAIIWAAIVVALGGVLVLGWREHRFGERLHEVVMPLWLRVEPYALRLKLALRRLPGRGKHEPKRRGLSAHHHTGKVLAHHHTSYPALAFLVIVGTVLSMATAWSTRAASSDLSLTVLGPPPSVGATIDQPVTDDDFTAGTTTVRGTCPAGLLVEVYRNSVFAGSDTCDTGGMYQVLISLDVGMNVLVARDADALGQYGPNSNTVTVTYTYTPPPTPTPVATPQSVGPLASAVPKPVAIPKATSAPTGTKKPLAAKPVDPLRLMSDLHFYQGITVNEPVQWQLQVAGGTKPYHLTWDAGDGRPVSNTDVAEPGNVANSHRYRSARMYQVTVRVRDAVGNTAVMQLAVIVNGQAAGGLTTRPPRDNGELVWLWPALSLTAVVVFCFWLGEHHEFALARAREPLTD